MEILLYLFLPILMAAIPLILGGIVLLDAIDRMMGGRPSKAVLRVFGLLKKKHD